jgi:hypothetical protein
MTTSFLYLLVTLALKGQCHEIFDLRFFSWISFHQAPEDTIRAVSIFFICGDIRSSRCITKKCSTRKVFIIFLAHLWWVELPYRWIFSFKFPSRCHQSDIVSMICHQWLWHRRQICLRCTVIDTVGNLALVSLLPVANLAPVSLIPMVHLY